MICPTSNIGHAASILATIASPHLFASAGIPSAILNPALVLTPPQRQTQSACSQPHDYAQHPCPCHPIILPSQKPDMVPVIGVYTFRWHVCMASGVLGGTCHGRTLSRPTAAPPSRTALHARNTGELNPAQLNPARRCPLVTNFGASTWVGAQWDMHSYCCPCNTLAGISAHRCGHRLHSRCWALYC